MSKPVVRDQGSEFNWPPATEHRPLNKRRFYDN